MQSVKNHIVKVQVISIIAVIGFIIGSTMTAVNTKRDIEEKLHTMENQYNHVHKWYNTLEAKQEIIEDNNQEQDLVLVEIRTKLNNIETILLEIKQDRR
jgi:hypothetical protein